MVGIVQSQTSHCLDMRRIQWRQQQADVGDLVCYLVLSKNISSNYTSLSRFCNIRDIFGKDSITIVSAAISGEETNKAL